MSTPARTDLHLYSRHSSKAAEWLLRRLEFPASYSEPAELYEKLVQSGMSFVTITDHHSIDGCLEIADRPNVFLSEEVTTFFPEDGCKVHLLIWGLNEKQHEEVHQLRASIFDLQKYLAGQGLAHGVATPLLPVNEKLEPHHLERLCLLFRHFESINGLRNSLLSEAATEILRKLTPERIAEFAERHRIEPTHPEPWKKIFFAGSDDHGLIQPARAYTETPAAADPGEFLEQLKAGNVSPVGEGGTPLLLAHNTYSVAIQYTKAKLLSGKEDASTAALLEKVFARFMEGQNPTEFTFGEKIGFLVHGVATGQIFEMARVGGGSLWKELAGYFSRPDVRKAVERETAGVKEPEVRAFLIANIIGNQLAYRLFTEFVSQISAGKVLESIQLASPLVPIVTLLSPYGLAYRMPDRGWLRKCARSIAGEVPPLLRNDRRAWFTDTLEDVNGVTTTIRKMSAAGRNAGKHIVVVTSRSGIDIPGVPIKNFEPIGEFELPEYELQQLSFPPILHMIDWLERERITELIVSTPGPVGLVGLLAAKTLGLRTVGIYHTDFPQYVRILTDDSVMETLTWNFMHWFYSQLDVVFVNSEDYRKCWIDRGIPAERLEILPRGLDIELFHPRRRSDDFWTSRGVKPGETKLLFVGRISKEKNLDLIVASYRKLRERGIPARAIFVGDGPYLENMKSLLPDGIFTGYMAGEELATAYASADIFVFPSTTDTFGNVVIEAHASGVPAIVSDVGGPRDLVTEGVDGYITHAGDAEQFTDAVEALATDESKRQEFGRAARRKVESRDWAAAFQKFWDASPA